jgi:hypothetical protein
LTGFACACHASNAASIAFASSFPIGELRYTGRVLPHSVFAVKKTLMVPAASTSICAIVPLNHPVAWTGSARPKAKMSAILPFRTYFTGFSPFSIQRIAHDSDRRSSIRVPSFAVYCQGVCVHRPAKAWPN